MKNKKMIIIYISIIGLIAISLLGLTYGYVTARIDGNETSKNVSAISQVLKMEFTDGSESLTSTLEGYFNPGSELTKTFTFKNTGNKDLNYNIIIDELNNNFVRNDITYELYMNDNLLNCPVYNIDSETSKCLLPKENPAYLATNLNIEINETQSFKLVIKYNKSEENQIVDAGKTIGGSISVEENTLKNLLIYGNSVQDGTPEPEIPIEIESVGNKIVNLFDKSNANVFNGYISANKLNYYNPKVSSTASVVIECKPNTTYTISRQIFSERFVVGTSQYAPANDIAIPNQIGDSSAQYLTVTSGENDKYLYVWFFNSNYDTHTYEEIMNGLVIEEGMKPSDYQNIGKYVIPINVTTKNLFDQDGWYDFFANNNGTQLEKLSNSVVVDGHECMSWHPENGYDRTGSTNKGIVFPFDGKENTRYTISFTCKKNDREGNYTTGIGFRYSDGTSTSVFCDKTLEWNTAIGSSSAGKTVVGLTMPYSWDGIVYFRKDSIKLYEGVYNLNNIGNYVPYENNLYNIILNEPLRKIGDCVTCADYIDLNEGKIYRNVKQHIITGEENWSLYQTTTPGIFKVPLTDTKLEYKSSLCTHYENIQYAWDNVYSNRIGIYSDHNTTNYKYFRAPNSSATTLEDFKSWLTTQYNNKTPVKLNYLLATTSAPEDITISNPVLINSNSIVNINTNIEPSNIVIE